MGLFSFVVLDAGLCYFCALHDQLSLYDIRPVP